MGSNGKTLKLRETPSIGSEVEKGTHKQLVS